MGLDPRIAQSVQPFQMEPQSVAMMRALQLMGAQRQNALAQMQMQDYTAERQARPAQQQNALAIQNQQRNYLGSIDASQGPAMPFSVPNALAMGLPMDQIKALNEALGPRKVARVIDTANGQQQADEYGSPVGAPLPRYVAPQLVDQGNQKQFVTPTAGASFPVGMTPAQAAQDRRAGERLGEDRRQFGITQAAAGEQRAFERAKPAVEAAPKAMTEGQAKANLFGSRAEAADKLLSEMAAKGATRPGAIKGFAEATGNILGLGTESMGGALADAAGRATNWTQSASQQQVEQAQRDFVNAVLRRESGAVIGAGEFRNAEVQYFPQPGDSDAVKKQKADNRRMAVRGILAEVPKSGRDAMAPEGAAPQRNITVDW